MLEAQHHQYERLKTALGAEEISKSFDICYLATIVAARYPDNTYSALRIQRSHDHELAGDEEWLTATLRRAPRRPLQPGCMLEFEDY